MRTLVTADIHGGRKTFLQCLERSKFDNDKDRLIVLGDVCDGWGETKEVIEELLKIKNLIFVIGNHDIWALDWMQDEEHRADNMIWVNQGGAMTLKSYEYQNHINIPDSHIEFLKNKSHLWYEENNILFVHGGIKVGSKVEDNKAQDMIWNRELIETAYKNMKSGVNLQLTPYKEVWVGHTSTWLFGKGTPIIAGGVIDVDTGGGYEGKLTIMDLDTKEYWQSDKASNLYVNDFSWIPGAYSQGCDICMHPVVYKDNLCRTCWTLEDEIDDGEVKKLLYRNKENKHGLW